MRAGSPIFRRGVGKALAVWLMLLSVASAGLTPAAQCVGQGVSAGLTVCGETRACCCRARAVQKPACCCQVKEKPTAPVPLRQDAAEPTVKWLSGIVVPREPGATSDTNSRVATTLERPITGRCRSVQTLFCIWLD